MDIYSPEGVKRILSEKGYFLSRTRGQNYLVNKNLAYKIAEIISKTIESQEIEVIEVGSGLGSITIPLAERFSKVISIEIDKGIYECLIKIVKESNLENKINLINKDFLKMKPNEITQSQKTYIFVSNLPYSVGGEILRKVIYEYNIEHMFVMVQKEFFERMIAKPDTENYSLLSVMSQLNTKKIKKLLDISRNNFFPIPSVDSVFLHIVKSENLVNNNTLDYIVKFFSNRRKNLLNSITLSCRIDKTSAKNILDTLGIDYNKRIENLTPQEILTLTKFIEKQI